MNKYLLLDCLLIFVFIIAIGLLFYDLTSHSDAKSECTMNPLIYGAKEISERNRANFSCTCMLDKPNSPLVFFDSFGMNVDYPNRMNTRTDYSDILKDLKPSPNQ